MRAVQSLEFGVIEEVTTFHKPEEVMIIFESGAAAGYLNRQYYTTRIDATYVKTFREIVRTSFQGQAGNNGKVKLVFNRIYLVATKSAHE